MKTAFVAFTLLISVAMASVAAASDHGYSSSIQQAYRHQQAEQMKADRAFDKIASDVEKSIPRVAFPVATGNGSGWGTAATAGRVTGLVAPSRVTVTYTCPKY